MLTYPLTCEQRSLSWQAKMTSKPRFLLTCPLTMYPMPNYPLTCAQRSLPWQPESNQTVMKTRLLTYTALCDGHPLHFLLASSWDLCIAARVVHPRMPTHTLMMTGLWPAQGRWRKPDTRRRPSLPLHATDSLPPTRSSLMKLLVAGVLQKLTRT